MQNQRARHSRWTPGRGVHRGSTGLLGTCRPCLVVPKRPLPLGNCHVRPLCGAEFCDSQSDVEQYLDDCIVSCVAVLLDGTE